VREGASKREKVYTNKSKGRKNITYGVYKDTWMVKIRERVIGDPL
jgi:hypothetical protein